MTSAGSPARARRPGFFVSTLPPLSLLLCALALACGSREPAVPTGPRVWQGPTPNVSSTGATQHERREIAQRISLPLCLSVAGRDYRFARVEPYAGGGTTPPGLTDTFYRLDRWRLWTRPGLLSEQPVLFVTVRGSTGIVAEYERIAAGERCEG